MFTVKYAPPLPQEENRTLPLQYGPLMINFTMRSLTWNFLPLDFYSLSRPLAVRIQIKFSPSYLPEGATRRDRNVIHFAQSLSSLSRKRAFLARIKTKIEIFQLTLGSEFLNLKSVSSSEIRSKTRPGQGLTVRDEKHTPPPRLRTVRTVFVLPFDIYFNLLASIFPISSIILYLSLFFLFSVPFLHPLAPKWHLLISVPLYPYTRQ
jgi:hypothetical protein